MKGIAFVVKAEPGLYFFRIRILGRSCAVLWHSIQIISVIITAVGHIQIIVRCFNLNRIRTLNETEAKRCTAVLFRAAVYGVIRIFNVRARRCGVIRRAPVALIKPVIIHQRKILHMKCTGLSENVDITQAGPRNRFRKSSACIPGVEISQVDVDVAICGRRCILIRADSCPRNPETVICLIGPRKCSALLKLRSFARKHHMNFCGLGKIPFRLVNLKLQPFSIPSGIVDIKTACNQITGTERRQGIFRRRSLITIVGNHASSHRFSERHARRHAPNTADFTRHEGIAVRGIAKRHCRIRRRCIQS